ERIFMKIETVTTELMGCIAQSLPTDSIFIENGHHVPVIVLRDSFVIPPIIFRLLDANAASFEHRHKRVRMNSCFPLYAACFCGRDDSADQFLIFCWCSVGHFSSPDESSRRAAWSESLGSNLQVISAMRGNHRYYPGRCEAQQLQFEASRDLDQRSRPEIRQPSNNCA